MVRVKRLKDPLFVSYLKRKREQILKVIGNDWDTVLNDIFESDHFKQLMEFLNVEYNTQTIYPPRETIFSALKTTPYSKVKVVVIGQDPYHGPNQAHGMCFSVQPGVKPPPSLVNIYKELQQEYGYSIPRHGNLMSWSQQGVLLLNAILTVRGGQPMSHKGKGWEEFTDTVIQRLSERDEPMVFLLWGAPAQKKVSLINTKKHLVLKTSHPSPLSSYRGFSGCGHFKMTNEFLKKYHMTPIDWEIKEIKEDDLFNG